MARDELRELTHHLRRYLEHQSSIGVTGLVRAPSAERQEWEAWRAGLEAKKLEALKAALHEPETTRHKTAPRAARPSAPAAPTNPGAAGREIPASKSNSAPDVSGGNQLWKQIGSRPVHLFKDQPSKPKPAPPAPKPTQRPRVTEQAPKRNNDGFVEVQRTIHTPQKPPKANQAQTPALFGDSSEQAHDPKRWALPMKGFDATPELQQRLDTMTSSSKLEFLRDCLGDCTRCKLHTKRKNIVFGDGDPNADLVFVGEGPGFNEDKRGIPFVGKAGNLLDRMIVAMGIERQDVYIANVVKCRPPNNRDPEPDEIAKCAPFLYKQLETVNPKVIITLGRFASQCLLDTKRPMRAMRGRWQEWRGIQVMPTYHPAYLLRNPAGKRDAWSDLQMVMKELGL